MARRPEAVARTLLGDVTEVPVPVERLARLQGIQVTYELYQGDTSGLLIHEPDGHKTIGVNTFHSETRQRFTIAHELGHALLHLGTAPETRPDVVVDKPREVLFRDGRSSAANDRKEIEANRFAAELLMPATLVREAFHGEVQNRRPQSTEALVNALAAEFAVSAQAMSYRLINLDLIEPV